MTAQLDVYTAKLDDLADDPHYEPTGLAAATRTAEDAQDALDAALIEASGQLPASVGRLMSKRASSVDHSGNTDWRSQAACRAAPPADADAFTEARSQAEGARVIREYCAGCPLPMTVCVKHARHAAGECMGV